jgi:hypothetical protein
MNLHQRGRGTGHHAVLAIAALALVPLLFAACGEEADETAATRPVHVALKKEIATFKLERLDAADHTAPELWLASREAGRDISADDPAVARHRQALAVASRRFREYPRMIANRAVQLEAMLERQNIAEPAPALIARLVAVPGDQRYVESFGALCQQYYNLRMQGRDPDAAVHMLKDVADAGTSRMH